MCQPNKWMFSKCNNKVIWSATLAEHVNVRPFFWLLRESLLHRYTERNIIKGIHGNYFGVMVYLCRCGYNDWTHLVCLWLWLAQSDSNGFHLSGFQDLWEAGFMTCHNRLIMRLGQNDWLIDDSNVQDFNQHSKYWPVFKSWGVKLWKKQGIKWSKNSSYSKPKVTSPKPAKDDS